MGTAFAATAAALAVSAAIAGETPAPRQTKGIAFEAPGHAVAEGVPVVARGGDPGATWVLLDWRGRQTGIVGVFDSGGESRLPPLPAGYYRLGNATLAVVAPQRSAVGGAVSDTTFFALDSAQSWLAAKGQFKCPWNEGDTFRTVSDLIALAGIRHVRERMAWAGVHRDPDNPDYGKYMVNADLLRERGIHVSGLFADAPKCTVPKTGKIPSNLAAVFDGCARLATDFSNRMEDWEFWNEPDSGIAPPWDYAAALKAAYLGFKAGCPDIAVLPASHCAGPDTAWARVLYDNDAAKFGDAFNYHTYARPSGYPALFARMREFLGCYGISDRAIWVTEAGTELEGPARSSGAMEGMKAHSPGQELVVAEFYPKSQIGLMMEGVARNYFFVFCPYNERDGGKDWGAMRRDGTVKPVYAAMATMTREIGDAGLVGEIKVGDGVKAYLFERTDGSQTIAFWSVSPLDAADGGIVSPEPDFARTVRLEVSAAAAETSPVILSDLCGMRSTMTAAGGVLELAATRFPAYASGLRGLVADIPARPAGKVSPYEPEAGEDLSVVLRVELDESGFALENSKTVARLLGDSGRVKVQVWNLGDCAKTGRVEVAGVRLSGIPETVIVGPRGTLPAEFECHIEPLISKAFSAGGTAAASPFRCCCPSGFSPDAQSSRLHGAIRRTGRGTIQLPAVSRRGTKRNRRCASISRGTTPECRAGSTPFMHCRRMKASIAPWRYSLK